MSQDYNYDEQGQFFPYFVLTITGLVTLPVTYSLLKPSKELESTAPRIQTDFKPDNVDLIDAQRKKQKRKERKMKRMIFAISGWLVMAWMVYLMVVTTRTIPKIWDPYEVLGVSRSADESQIKKHYKKLSILHHPDKAKPDPERNITIESINEYWVEMTKAFKTLTDEEIRNNYLQYGHPDGKQSFSIGIALPQWIVTEGHGRYVLLGYAVVLAVLLPYVVGKWWYGTQRMTKEKVLVASAGNIFQEYQPFMNEAGVVNALSTGEEFKEILKGNKADAGSSKVEQRIAAEGEATPLASGMTVKDKTDLEQLDDAVRRKALALLWAYLGRIELDDATLNSEKYEVAPTALQLNESFIAIALAYGITRPLMSGFQTAQNLIQAIPPGASPLLQLPYFTPAIAKAVEGETAKTHLTVQEFMRIPSDQRRQRSVGSGLLSPSQYKEVLQVASQLPTLNVEKAFFKVTGERVVTPSSLVSLVVKARVIPPGTTNVPEVNELDLEDVDPDEGDLEALRGKRKKVKTVEGVKTVTVDEEQSFPPPIAYAPYFARDHSPRWHVFLTDSKQGKIAVPPFTFTTFEKPLFDESGKPTFNMQTFKMSFGAPPQPGRYTFVMNLVCDSYIGMDYKSEVTMVVEEPPKVEEIEEDEISEPEEDSLAGQMGALKGSAVKKARKPVDSDESDTEGDEETESETDTDTDSDEE